MDFILDYTEKSTDIWVLALVSVCYWYCKFKWYSVTSISFVSSMLPTDVPCEYNLFLKSVCARVT